MPGFIYFFKIKCNQESLYSIGISTDLLETIYEEKPDEILNISRCSNYIALEKEIHLSFSDCKTNHSSNFQLNEDQIESIHLIIRAKSQY